MKSKRGGVALALALAVAGFAGRRAEAAGAGAGKVSPAAAENSTPSEGGAIFDSMGDAQVQPLEPPPTALVSDRATRLLAIQGSAFYDTVGRADLARSYEARRRGKLVVSAIGGIGIGAGIFGALLVALGNNFHVDGPTCEEAHNCTSYAVPAALVAGGLLLSVVPAAIPDEPVTELERRELAEAAAARIASAPALGLSLAPRVDGGGSLMVNGRF
jgi:hypothetical protein